ncbi:hypothetical protein ACN27F_30680 [Solwaraspora sp. WMMB335]|uniref:hypothetical protein n=1 Tax=Solwaraspora sp. WMMB335 TaxID=3404118 RepID=UPI003B93C422
MIGGDESMRGASRISKVLARLVVGRWRGRFVHLPMPLVVRARNQVDSYGDLWLSALEATGQPPPIA